MSHEAHLFWPLAKKKKKNYNNNNYLKVTKIKQNPKEKD